MLSGVQHSVTIRPPMSLANSQKLDCVFVEQEAHVTETVEAYERDVRQFLAFMHDHLGQSATLAALARLAPRDTRVHGGATKRGIGRHSLMRMLAEARSVCALSRAQ